MHPRSSNTRTSSSDRHEVFSTDSAFGPPALLGSLARSHAPTNSKVFELCTRFQLLSQPNGLCSSSRPCVSRSISVFDRDLPAFQTASSVSPFITAIAVQSTELALQFDCFAG